MLDDAVEQRQIVVLEFVTIGLGGGRYPSAARIAARVLRKRPAGPCVKTGVQDIWLGTQRSQGFVRRFRIIELQRGSGVVADHLCQGREIPEHFPAECDYLAGDKRRARHQQSHAAGHHDDEGLFALKGGPLKNWHANFLLPRPSVRGHVDHIQKRRSDRWKRFWPRLRPPTWRAQSTDRTEPDPSEPTVPLAYSSRQLRNVF